MTDKMSCLSVPLVISGTATVLDSGKLWMHFHILLALERLIVLG